MNANFDLDLIGFLSYPFAAKFGGVCALSGERFTAGEKIRMTTRTGDPSLPVLYRWSNGGNIDWQGSKVAVMDELMAAIEALSPEANSHLPTRPAETIVVWTSPAKSVTVSRFRGALTIDGSKVTMAQAAARLRGAKIWKLRR